MELKEELRIHTHAEV